MAREQYQKAQQNRTVAPTTASQQDATRQAVEAQNQVTTLLQEPVASDRYKVNGPGGLFLNGVLHQAGSVVCMSEADALSVLDTVEQILG